MAGTLITQNIQGPSTGANANKILIPSGQTLDVSSGTLTPSAGQIVKTASTIDGGFYSFTATSYTEVTTNYRINFTPSFSNSLIILEWTGIVGGNNSSLIKNAKWWDVTSSTDVPSQPNPSSRTLAHGSWRHVDTDGNDRDNLTMKAYFPSWGTTQKTFTTLFKTEGGTGYLGATVTNNTGCTYAPTIIIATEIKQ